MTHDGREELQPLDDSPPNLGVVDGLGGDVVERLAELVVARLLAESEEASGLVGPGSQKLLTVGQVAELLGVPRDYVYRHKEALGVIRLPSEGQRGALRFDRDSLRERLRGRAAPSSRAAAGSRRRARPSRGPAAAADLLPVRPRQAA